MDTTYDPTKWFRTCQSCGKKQNTPEPKEGESVSQAYCHRKCKYCKSEDLDYGTVHSADDNSEDQS